MSLSLKEPMRMSRTRSRLDGVIAVVLLCAPLWGAPIRAQDGDVLDDPPAGEDQDGEERAESTETQSSSPEEPKADVKQDPAEGAAAAEVPAGEGEETIYVVQGKPFLMGGRFEIAPQLSQSINDRFTSHSGLILSGIYHIKENIAFEVSGGMFFWWDDPLGGQTAPRLGGRATDLTTEILTKERVAPEPVQLYQMTWMLTSDMQWSPFYGKVNLQDFILGQFNMYLSVGAGVAGIQLDDDALKFSSGAAPDGGGGSNGQVQDGFVVLPGPFGVDYLPPMQLTTTFGGGLRFYFLDWLGVRFEVRDYVMPLAVLSQDVTVPFSTFNVTNVLLAQLGVSFIF